MLQSCEQTNRQTQRQTHKAPHIEAYCSAYRSTTSSQCSGLTLLEFCRLLKTHLCSWRSRLFVTILALNRSVLQIHLLNCLQLMLGLVIMFIVFSWPPTMWEPATVIVRVVCPPVCLCMCPAQRSPKLSERDVRFRSVLFFSRPRSERWPHYGRTFSIGLRLLSFWLTSPRTVLSTSWCCPSRPCVAFLACVHLALFLALCRFLVP